MWRSVSAFLNISLFKHRLGFQDLPLEILSEIASYFWFLDFIAFRQASRKLRDATEARFLWTGLAREYCMRHLNYPRPPTGTGELRKWITERYIVDEVWKKPMAQIRSVDLPPARSWSSAVAMVPGGRWALLGTSSGYVYAYDLCSQLPQPFPLIIPKNNIAGDFQPASALVISVDSQAPILQFTLAFTANETYSWLRIWRVRLGPSDVLSAEKLLSIPCSEYSPRLSISDTLIARSLRGYSEVWWGEVFWWKECSEKHITKSTIKIKPGAHLIRIIGTDRLLCFNIRKGVYIYDIPEPKTVQYPGVPVPRFDESLALCSHTWFYPLRSPWDWGCSQLYFDGVYYRQVISTDHSGILGFVVPASKKELPYVINLAPHLPRQPIFSCLGLYKGYAPLSGGGVRYIYSWGKGFPDGPVHHSDISGKQFKLARDSWARAAFDEETGRSIGISWEGCVTLIDFQPS